jgi:hypothetical protein
MGVIYKLKDEVVHFIVSQRQGDPLLSCRQLAESASQQFGVRFSKSSVHDVLKESGVVTPRGRKPKDKFQIPIEKKQQIQTSLSKVMLQSVPSLELLTPKNGDLSIPPKGDLLIPQSVDSQTQPLQKGDIYEGAGRIFIKAALWDLGLFSEDNISEDDWSYYLIYTSSLKVDTEDGRSYVIDWPLPLHRSIREAADGMVNNIKPLIVYKVSDENLFKASMNAQPGAKAKNVAIVDRNGHVLCEFNSLVDAKRTFKLTNRVFVESTDRNLAERAKTLFFSQTIDNNKVMENILSLKGFDSANKEEYVVNILTEDGYVNKDMLQQAIEKLNGMYLRDDQNRLLSVILSPASSS